MGIFQSYRDFIAPKRRLKGFLLKALILLSISAMLLIAFKQIVPIFITILLIALASISKLYKHFIGFSLGFELVTFVSILFFFSHGLLLGILLSIIMLVASTLISGRFSQILVFQAIVYVVLGIVSLFLRNIGIVNAGKILVVLYNVSLHSISLLFLRMPIHSSVLNLVVNVSSNFLILDAFGEYLYYLLQS